MVFGVFMVDDGGGWVRCCDLERVVDWEFVGVGEGVVVFFIGVIGIVMVDDVDWLGVVMVDDCYCLRDG